MLLPLFIMNYCKSPHVLFRDYPNFGYLTDNRNFGYDTAIKSSRKIGDRIISKVGSVIYSILNEQPQSLKEISEKLSQIFTDVPLQILENDANDFLTELSSDGFVICLEDAKCEDADNWFSYANLENRSVQENTISKSSDSFDSNWFANYRLTRLHLNISSACNEHCIHCYFPNHTKRETMSKELFNEIIAQCKKLNVLNITMSGGEPMLNPNLAFFIQKGREANFSINILSNLIFLTDDLIEEFKNTPLLSVQTSLYSLNEDIHDSITGVKGSCNRTKNAIEKLYELNIPMQINCPIMKQNKNSFQNVLDWAKSLNIEASSDYMLFGCFDGSRKNLHCRLELDEIESLIEEMHTTGDINSNMDKSPSQSSICPVCYSSLCISPLGKIYPCEGWQSYILGDVRHSSIKDVWENSPDVLSLRDLTIKDFPQCMNCENKDYCSICLIRNVNESDTLDCRDLNPYFCAIAKIKRQIANNNRQF